MPYATKPMPGPPPSPYLEYYQPLYQYLHRKYSNQLENALLVEPLALRKKQVAKLFQGVGRIPHEKAWDLLYGYLEKIERRLAAVIGSRSTVYWYHLYRRIAPFLSPQHDGKVDDVTIILVRQIAELAILKYGKKAVGQDLVSAASVNYETYLKGFYRDACRETKLGDKVGERLLAIESTGGTLIPGELSPSDFIDLYRIEGLSYEYWRTTASLRAIGKRTDVAWNDRRNWFTYYFDKTPQSLFDYYDGRLGQDGGLSTHFGTWFHHSQPPSSLDFFVWATYEPGGEPEAIDLTTEAGKTTRVTFRPNFRVGQEAISAFWKRHAFAEADFTKRYGVSLSAVIFSIWAISIRATIPLAFLRGNETDAELKRMLNVSAMNLRRRAYTLHDETIYEFMEFAVAIANGLKYPLRIPDMPEALRAAEFISFSEVRNPEVALWAGGKRYPLLPHDKLMLIDIAAINNFLEGLFFRVGDASQLKGAAFEDAVREYLTEQGFPILHHGRLRWNTGAEREVDAAIRVGDVLVILECVSAERPLDFEIGRPRTYERRIQILSDKLAQAMSLAEAIRSDPGGRNFDFSWAAEVEWRVVSPHHEFLWCEGEPCFTADGRPRIVEPFAARDLLMEHQRRRTKT